VKAYELKEMAIECLQKAGYNPRKNLQKNDPEYEALKKSIVELGMIDPIVWNECTGTVVGGHQRLTVLADLGYTTAPCFVVNLSPAQEKQANVRLNSIKGAWDYDKLAAVLADFSPEEVAAANLDPKDLQALYAREQDLAEDDFDVAQSIAAHETPTTKPGDIILLGEHRLMCGDATNKEHAAHLMDGRLADMIFTDPPYNVNYHGGTKEKLSILNDHMTKDAFFTFLLDAFTNMTAHLKNGGAAYVCHADSEGVSFRRAFEDAGLMFKQCLVWVKNSLVLGRQDYQWQHEPILYGWKPGSKHQWCGDRKQSTVIRPEDAVSVAQEGDGYLLSLNVGLDSMRIRVPTYEVVARTEDSTLWLENKPMRNAEHPTMKPIRLCGRGIRNSSRRGELVVDYFGGSGSTLMAAEQLDRTCYCMELDPRFCDVIVDRWEKLTGRSALRHG